MTEVGFAPHRPTVPLTATMIAPTLTEESATESPWLTLLEGAEYARALRPNGRPRDSFYTAIKRHIGERRLVRVSELDRLIEEGKL